MCVCLSLKIWHVGSTLEASKRGRGGEPIMTASKIKCMHKQCVLGTLCPTL